MNKVRRKRVQDAITKIEEAKAILEDAQDEEQAAFDNMPEGLQYGKWKKILVNWKKRLAAWKTWLVNWKRYKTPGRQQSPNKCR